MLLFYSTFLPSPKNGACKKKTKMLYENLNSLLLLHKITSIVDLFESNGATNSICSCNYNSFDYLLLLINIMGSYY